MVRTNRCTGKADGFYVVSDVFQYLECKAGAEIMHSCPDNMIFVAKKMNCSAVTTADEGSILYLVFGISPSVISMYPRVSYFICRMATIMVTKQKSHCLQPTEQKPHERFYHAF